MQRAPARNRLRYVLSAKTPRLKGNGMAEHQAKEDLETYLQDHYAAAVGALELIEHLREAHAEDRLRPFLARLQAEVASDHEQLHNLMTALELKESSVRNAASWTAEKFSRLKLGFTDKDVQLRLLQSLETLALGLTGKLLLWRALQAVQESSPILQRTDLEQMAERAREQIEKVESERRKAAQAALSAR